MKVRYSYLSQQFAECEDLWEELKAFVPIRRFHPWQTIAEV